MKLYIFGAGGGALHILQDTLWFNKYDKLEFKPSDIILVEDNPKSDVISIAGNEYSLIPYKDFRCTPDDCGHISAFNIKYKERINSEVKLNWINSYSNTYARFPDIEMGYGVRINWCSFVDGKVKIGNSVKLNAFVFIGHGSSIGDYTYISQHAILDSNVTVGKKCYIFENTTIFPEITVGNNTVIGAGSVVTKDIPDNVISYGSPCKVVRKNEIRY